MFQVHRLKKKLANDCQSYGSPTVISLSDRGFHSLELTRLLQLDGFNRST